MCRDPARRTVGDMADDPSSKPSGFSIDIGDILREATKPRRRRSTSTANSVDAGVRRAVRVELAGVERALKQLAEEVVRLRRANEDLADKVARLTKR